MNYPDEYLGTNLQPETSPDISAFLQQLMGAGGNPPGPQGGPGMGQAGRPGPGMMMRGGGRGPGMMMGGGRGLGAGGAPRGMGPGGGAMQGQDGLMLLMMLQQILGGGQGG